MSTDVTQMLRDWSDGDQEALDRLLPVLYDQLRRMAHARMRGERVGHTLNTTGLVHEAYLRLVDVNRIEWKDRSHFLAMASRTMRRVLMDHARNLKAQKRGAGMPKEELQEEFLMPAEDAEKLLELDDAMERLENDHPRRAQAVELRYFGGLTLEETAEVLGTSAPTVMRDVRFAEAWLAREWGGNLDSL
jgi:RNA polymerase sigma factor (TIGR02999 family)